jgi:hypothetical protein
VTGITVAAGILPDSDDIDGGERRTVRAESLNLGNSTMNNLVHELAETELDRVCGGEMKMITLQNMMSQRHTMVQLTTNLLRAMSDTTSAIIQNIK